MIKKKKKVVHDVVNISPICPWFPRVSRKPPNHNNYNYPYYGLTTNGENFSELYLRGRPPSSPVVISIAVSPSPRL